MSPGAVDLHAACTALTRKTIDSDRKQAVSGSATSPAGCPSFLDDTGWLGASLALPACLLSPIRGLLLTPLVLPGRARLGKSWQGSCRSLQLPGLSVAGSAVHSGLIWLTKAGLCPAESFIKSCKAAPPNLCSLQTIRNQRRPSRSNNYSPFLLL